MNAIFIMGTCSSGKTVFAKKLAASLSIKHYSAGEAVREEFDITKFKNPHAAEECEKFVQGRLTEWLRFSDGPIIIEGVPRSERQVDIITNVTNGVLFFLDDDPGVRVHWAATRDEIGTSEFEHSLRRIMDDGESEFYGALARRAHEQGMTVINIQSSTMWLGGVP